ncbi:MAG: hypothetical protein KDA78_14555 [Planctomycetaceae bacterium]|nr:hypothetical protein [Planctomycetaceae bacterium]
MGESTLSLSASVSARQGDSLQIRNHQSEKENSANIHPPSQVNVARSGAKRMGVVNRFLTPYGLERQFATPIIPLRSILGVPRHFV